MLFVLVRVRDERIDMFAPYLPWRATHVGERTIDVFFWATSQDAAEAEIVKRYPDATFTHSEKMP